MPPTEHLLAVALFSQGQWDEAIVHYTAYLVTEPNDAGALNNLGVALASTGKLDDAIVVFRHALAVDSLDGAAERNLANALAARRALDQANVQPARQPMRTVNTSTRCALWLSGLVIKSRGLCRAIMSFRFALLLPMALVLMPGSLKEPRTGRKGDPMKRLLVVVALSLASCDSGPRSGPCRRGHRAGREKLAGVFRFSERLQTLSR